MHRSQCPICQKSYKTPDWLKDHIRRGHGYTKEVCTPIMLNHTSQSGHIRSIKTPILSVQATDSLMDKLKLKPVNPHRLKNNNTAAISAN